MRQGVADKRQDVTLIRQALIFIRQVTIYSFGYLGCVFPWLEWGTSANLTFAFDLRGLLLFLASVFSMTLQDEVDCNTTGLLLDIITASEMFPRVVGLVLGYIYPRSCLFRREVISRVVVCACRSVIPFVMN